MARWDMANFNSDREIFSFLKFDMRHGEPPSRALDIADTTSQVIFTIAKNKIRVKIKPYPVAVKKILKRLSLIRPRLIIERAPGCL